MRILITGRDGQVAQAIAECGTASGADIVRLGRPAFDLAEDEASIVSAIKTEAPDLIVSAAAYTAVDRAEAEPDAAFAVNERGAAAVGRAAANLDVPLIHLSTDYVFDGAKPSPYVESDEPAPNTVYGRSKLAGERAVLEATGNCAILRTAWVYSPYAANFVKTMLRLAQSREEIGVVGDQQGNPTSAIDIADGILKVANNLMAKDDAQLRGVFHMAGHGEATWASFAQAIFEESAAAGGPSARVKPITTAEFPTAATRPANSRLDGKKLFEAHGVRLPSWRASLPAIVERLVASNSERGPQ